MYGRVGGNMTKRKCDITVKQNINVTRLATPVLRDYGRSYSPNIKIAQPS